MAEALVKMERLDNGTSLASPSGAMLDTRGSAFWPIDFQLLEREERPSGNSRGPLRSGFHGLAAMLP